MSQEHNSLYVKIKTYLLRMLCNTPERRERMKKITPVLLTLNMTLKPKSRSNWFSLVEETTGTFFWMELNNYDRLEV